MWEEAEGELGQEGMNLWFSNRGRRIFHYEDQGGESKQARSCTSPAKVHSLLTPTTASTDNVLSMTLASGVSAHREGGGLLWQGSLESSQSDSCGGHITPVTWILVHTFEVMVSKPQHYGHFGWAVHYLELSYSLWQHLPSTCNNVNCLQTLPNIPQWTKSPLGENHGLHSIFTTQSHPQAQKKKPKYRQSMVCPRSQN